MTAARSRGRQARARVSLPKVEEFSTALRTMFINIGFFAATLLLIPALAVQVTRNAVVIEPIAVPAALAARGITPEVAANRLWDGLQDFAQSASAARKTVAAIPDSQLVEFSLPDAGISIDSVFTQIRQFFGMFDTRIGGEFLCATKECRPEGLRLRLRVVRSGSDIVDLPEMGTMSEQAYYREAAAGIFAVIDPYVAIAAQAESAPLRAATLARQLIAENTSDAKWAHNLVGDIERREGRPDRAIAAYEAALAIDEHFHTARAGLARAYIDAGDREAALSTLADLEMRDPDNTLAPPILAEIAIAAGDSESAIGHYRTAAEREPLNPEPLTRAGDLALKLGDTKRGIGLLNEALSIDPAHGEAMTLLAYAHIAAGDLTAAEATYRQWLDFEPENVDAIASLGNIQVAFGRNSEALATFDRALRLRPGDPEIGLMRAGALFALGRYREAIEALEPISAALPDDPLVFMLLGKAQKIEGRQSDAIAAFRRVLEIDPEGSGAPAAREALAALGVAETAESGAP